MDNQKRKHSKVDNMHENYFNKRREKEHNAFHWGNMRL